MNILFNDLNIQFTVENTSFFVLNMALERFLSPIPKHCHGNNSYELHYVSQGYGIVKIDGISYDISPNTFYVTGPYVEHEQIPYPADPMVEYSIYFKLNKQGTSTAYLDLFKNTTTWIGQDIYDMHLILKSLFRDLQTKKSGYMIRVRALLQLYIVMAIRNYEHTPSKSDKHFESVNLSDSKAFIVEKSFLYEYRDLTLVKLSCYLSLSTRQTERFLKNYYQKTFLQKRTDARMSAAAVFLNNKSFTLSDIAEKTGYSSVEYFVHAFKKYYQVSPREFQKKYI
ncbi:MAG: AraC family transcriptional regulator [Hespellia sp.]|nr:AraC family transcriptional regulator [Hespellia sp.]